MTLVETWWRISVSERRSAVLRRTMATKKEGCPCYESAADDEPIFTLRAQDVLSARVVEFWAAEAERLHVNPDKVREARECARMMKEWPNSRTPD